MRRLLAFAFTVLWGVACLSAQTLPSADSVLASVIAKHSGASVELASNSRLTGTISYRAGGSAPFTLTLQRRSVRFDTTGGNSPFSKSTDFYDRIHEGMFVHFEFRYPPWPNGPTFFCDFQE